MTLRVLEENQTNWLIMDEDGSTTTKTKSSDLNQLLYGRGLWGLLDSGDEIWSKGVVTIIPDEDAEQYTIEIANRPKLTLGKHRKTDLVDAMAEIYNEYDGDSVGPILELYEDVRKNMIREEVLTPFLDVFSEKVVERDDGWFINGHLLLTLEGDFYHPNTENYERDGNTVIMQGSSMAAYDVNIDSPSKEMSRSVTVDGIDYRLTEKEVTFIAKVIWGVKNTPDRT